MPLSKAKREKMAKAEREKHIRHISLNGRGWFMDAHHDATAKRYINSGDEALLANLPDYSDRRVKA